MARRSKILPGAALAVLALALAAGCARQAAESARPGATAALKKALEENPDDFDAHVTLGAILNSERDLDGARKHLDRAVQLRPDSGLARFELARVERTQGQLEAALKDFERVVHDNPDWQQPHIDLSALYYKLNRPEDGQRERAIVDKLSAQVPSR